MVGGLWHFSVSPSPFWFLDLIGTWLGLGLGVFGTKGLGIGLDNISASFGQASSNKTFMIHIF